MEHAAAERVLNNPDLVALILEKLPTPQLKFGVRSDAGSNDRLAASQVNSTFRRAALRLPWEAEWEEHDGRELDSKHSVEAMRQVLGSRNVRCWSIGLSPSWQPDAEETNRGAAAALNYARGTEELIISVGDSYKVRGNKVLAKWLHHTLVPLPGAGPREEGTPVLACLASLSRLTSLCVNVGSGWLGWTDASWLTAIAQLKHITLSRYAGVPVTGLPALESLRVEFHPSVSALEEWASPRLTDLTFSQCSLAKGLSVPSAQKPAVVSPDAREWLSRLERLILHHCSLQFYGTDPGFMNMVSGLSYLCFEGRPAGGSVSALLSKGLPERLKCLRLSMDESMWPFVFALKSLRSLVISQYGTFAPDAVASVVTGLKGLPDLRDVHLKLQVHDEAGVKEGFEALAALLRRRRGSLRLTLEPKSVREMVSYEQFDRLDIA